MCTDSVWSRLMEAEFRQLFFERERKSWRNCVILWSFNSIHLRTSQDIPNIGFPCTRSYTQETCPPFKEKWAWGKWGRSFYIPAKQKLNLPWQRETRTRAVWESFTQPLEKYYCRLPTLIAQNLYSALVCSTLVGLCASLVTFPRVNFSLAVDQGQRKADPWKADRTKSPTGFD